MTSGKHIASPQYLILAQLRNGKQEYLLNGISHAKSLIVSWYRMIKASIGRAKDSVPQYTRLLNARNMEVGRNYSSKFTPKHVSLFTHETQSCFADHGPSTFPRQWLGYIRLSQLTTLPLQIVSLFSVTSPTSCLLLGNSTLFLFSAFKSR